MRLFAALYAVTAIILGVARHDAASADLWTLVCLSAAGLAIAAAAKKPFVLAAAAHAGLTATWAGSLAARTFHQSRYTWWPQETATSMSILLMLCVGMAVLIGFGLKSAPRAAAQTSPQR